MKFVSSTMNKYEKMLEKDGGKKVQTRQDSIGCNFVSSVKRMNTALPYSNKTEMVTGKRVTFKHV